MNLSEGPLRVTTDQWADISDHYDQGEPDAPVCEKCGAPLSALDELETSLCWNCLLEVDDGCGS